MSNKSSNTTNVPEAREAMDKFKMEVASELGVPLSDGYNGNLTSAQNGSVGGYMVKKMIEAQEKQMAGKLSQSFSNLLNLPSAAFSGCKATEKGLTDLPARSSSCCCTESIPVFCQRHKFSLINLIFHSSGLNTGPSSPSDPGVLPSLILDLRPTGG